MCIELCTAHFIRDAERSKTILGQLKEFLSRLQYFCEILSLQQEWNLLQFSLLSFNIQSPRLNSINLLYYFLFHFVRDLKKQKFFLPDSGDKCSRSSRYVWYQLVWNRWSSEYFHTGVWHLIYKMSSLNLNCRAWDLSNWANTENLTEWHLPNLTRQSILGLRHVKNSLEVSNPEIFPLIS